MNRENKSTSVPAEKPDKQVEEDLWQRYGAERGVWTKNMLKALNEGVKGNKWFSLIDKVASDRTLAIGWKKVKSNAGSCGVDGITVGTFAKDSEKRLLAVNEHIKQGGLPSQTDQTGLHPESWKQRETTVGNPDGH